jgi:hypothetical protein
MAITFGICQGAINIKNKCLDLSHEITSPKI